jgi:uncharacterized protein YjaZ
MITHYCCIDSKCYFIYSKFENKRIKYELAIVNNIYGMEDFLRNSNAKYISFEDIRDTLNTHNTLSISTYEAATKKEESEQRPSL